jgi:hypothetical protein
MGAGTAKKAITAAAPARSPKRAHPISSAPARSTHDPWATPQPAVINSCGGYRCTITNPYVARFSGYFYDFRTIVVRRGEWMVPLGTQVDPCHIPCWIIGRIVTIRQIYFKTFCPVPAYGSGTTFRRLLASYQMRIFRGRAVTLDHSGQFPRDGGCWIIPGIRRLNDRHLAVPAPGSTIPNAPARTG